MRFVLAFGMALSVVAVNLAAPMPNAAAPAEIIPTVTVAMGDRGGLYFGTKPDPAKTRRYFIAAEPESWNYAPSGRDELCGSALPPSVVAAPRNEKFRYHQYTDATFQARIFDTESLGVMGPVLRGVIGDWIEVTFLNRTGQPLSLHPHGVHYDKDSEGSYYRPGPGLGAAVGPGAMFTYVWKLDEASGPLPSEPSSKAWLYHSHVSGDEETNLGLMGCIIVTDPARARADGTPKDVDREFSTLFMIFDESGLGADVKEAAEYANLPGAQSPPKTWAQVQELVEQGSRYAINGRIFGNLHGLEMNEGERVRWYLFALGSEQDFHTAHWHGLRVIEEGRRRTDVVELMPASMKVADLVADNPGDWLFHCHVAEHMREGMYTKLTIYPKDAVGASRRPEVAFLGMPEAAQSVHISRAEIKSKTTNAADFRFQLEGDVTVFEAMAVFNQEIQLRIGDRSIVFHPGPTGIATLADALLRIKNSGNVGVIYGGTMQFEIELSGPSWSSEIAQTQLAKNSTPARRGCFRSKSKSGPPLISRARQCESVPVNRRPQSRAPLDRFTCFCCYSCWSGRGCCAATCRPGRRRQTCRKR